MVLVYLMHAKLYTPQHSHTSTRLSAPAPINRLKLVLIRVKPRWDVPARGGHDGWGS